MGGKSPQGLAQQRKRRRKKNFSGPGKRFLSQGAGKAVPVEPAGPAPPAPCRCRPQDRGQGKRRGKGPGPFPRLCSMDVRQTVAVAVRRRRAARMPVRQAYGHGRETLLPSRASRRTAKVRPRSLFWRKGKPSARARGDPLPHSPHPFPSAFSDGRGSMRQASFTGHA